MLVIVMHNTQEYLNSLISLARKEGLTNTTVIENDGIGMQVIGERVNSLTVSVY